MENGNNINNILTKSTPPDRRRAYKYIRNIAWAVLIVSLLIVGALGTLNQHKLVPPVPMTGVRG